MWFLLGLLIGLAAGAAMVLGYVLFSTRSSLARMRQEVEQTRASLLREAETRSREIELAARQEALAAREAVEAQERGFEEERKTHRRELEEREARLDRREDQLDRRSDTFSHKEQSLLEREEAFEQRQKEACARHKQAEAELSRMLDETRQKLQQVSGMSPEEARAAFFQQLEEECRAEAGEVIRRSVESAQDEARERARTIILEAIQRYAAPQTADHTVSSVSIPDDAMKGRVIGREGRNIRSFEKATGVDVIIDDTPGVVVVSCFDPVRREVARIALERLVADGRIHPGRIEEVVQQAAGEMEEQLGDIGRDAAEACQLPNLPRSIIPLLGRLHFRTSYGQNVLRHSQEVANLAHVMAEELGLDSSLARRAGLLHDIGKALDHEAEGSHALIGAEFLRKQGEPEPVINAAAAHHGDVPATTPYTPLVMAADAISASRPGARRESLERYIKRLKELEDLATEFSGVRQAYAIHAGREIRVIADAHLVDDRISAKLARDIARKIGETLNFPGEIKVTVLREVRNVEYAR